ncbi:MAG: tRNA dihydrouridine synthase DusB [Holosporales bacterium]|jgi:tRNA-dihydrouridine synthase B|nr:tRNA dihydrouridine synthase DusB [Holosporales bacterium]
MDLILGEKKLKSRVFLAPMAGGTDLPFREIVRGFGDFVMYSEMVASYAVIRDVNRTRRMMELTGDEWTGIQIVGADPRIMAEAARKSHDLGAPFLDINMGCPVKKIVKTEAGSALMKNERLAAEIMRAVVRAVPIPVTLKIRLGWSEEHQNAIQIARIAQDSGIQMISVHGRTRSQLYTGKADWRAIRTVKESVQIPVIVNGDITSVETAKEALEEGRADGVMIGRGTLGAPWILRQIHDSIEGYSQDSLITAMTRRNTLENHIQKIFEFYPSSKAIINCKKVLMMYCRGTPNASQIRQQIMTIEDLAQINEIMQMIFE